MDVSLFSISLFTVLEQLRIGGSSRVVAVIGWCRLDHCNSHIVSNQFLWCSQHWNDLELKDSVESPLSSLKLWTKRILASEFFILKLPKASHPRQSCSLFSQVFPLSPFNSFTDRSWIKTSLAFYIPGLVSWVKVVSSWVFIHSITHSKLLWHKTDGHWALLLQAIQEWLLMLTPVMVEFHIPELPFSTV